MYIKDSNFNHRYLFIVFFETNQMLKNTFSYILDQFVIMILKGHKSVFFKFY